MPRSRCPTKSVSSAGRPVSKPNVKGVPEPGSTMTSAQSRVTDYFPKRRRRLSRSPPLKLKKDIDGQASQVSNQTHVEESSTTSVELKPPSFPENTIPHTPDVVLASDTRNERIDVDVSHRRRKLVVDPADEIRSVDPKRGAKRCLFAAARRRHNLADVGDSSPTVSETEPVNLDVPERPITSEFQTKDENETNLTELTKVCDVPRQTDGGENNVKTGPSTDVGWAVQAVAATLKGRGGVRNVSQLREALAASSDVAARLERQRDIAERQQRMKLAAASSPTKLTPEKNAASSEGPPKSPCYERYAALTARLCRTSSSASLPLPGHCAALLEAFRSLDVVCSMMHGRRERITFDKVRPAVQNIVGRNFERKNLGQIGTVYPEAYQCRVEQTTRRFAHRLQENTAKVEMVLEPNLETDLLHYSVAPPSPSKAIAARPSSLFSPIKLPVAPLLRGTAASVSPWKQPRRADDTAATTGQSAAAASDRVVFDGNRRMLRASIFKANLLGVVMKAHSEYLRQNNIELQETDTIERWHPRFLLESVAEIPPAELPSVEVEQRDGPKTAKDVLNNVLERQEAEQVTSTKQVDLVKVPSPKNPTLQGVSSSLLAKIRAKSAAKELKSMQRDPEKEKKRAQIKRLPALAPHIRMLYTVERKDSLAITVLLSKLAQSYPGLNAEELESHIDLICEILPKWLTKRRITNGVYVQIDSHIKDLIPTLTRRVEDYLDKHG